MLVRRISLLGLFAVPCLVSPIVAQSSLQPPPIIPYGMPITIENAKLAAAAAVTEARSHKWAMAIAIVDPAGMLVYFEKMTDAQNASAELALEKARTSALFRRPTRLFQEALAAGGDNLRVLGLTGVMPNAGGIPIVVNGKLIGAIGVSGGSVDQDAQVAQSGVGAVK
jgi:glc operon protein GlcG